MPSSSHRSNARIPGSIYAITLFGVPVRFHFTFVLLLIFLAVAGLKARQSVIADILFVTGIFASVLLHELGHAVVARRCGVRTLEIVMFPIGGVARMERIPRPRDELRIAIAGPAVNLVLAALLLGGLALWRGPVVTGPEALADPTDANLLERIAMGNLILALFNLLPAFPMDGGRILRSLLAMRRTEEEATQIASRAGRTLAVLMGLYGLISMHFLLVFIAFFVYLGAAQEGQAALGRSLMEGLPVRAAMITRYLTLSHGQTVGEAARLMLESTQQDFPVLYGDRVIGLLDRHRLLRAMANEGASAYIAGVMDREFPRLDPEMDLAEALPALAAAPCALVMEGERLLGLLTRENLSEFLVLRRFGLRPAPGEVS